MMSWRQFTENLRWSISAGRSVKLCRIYPVNWKMYIGKSFKPDSRVLIRKFMGWVRDKPQNVHGLPAIILRNPRKELQPGSVLLFWISRIGPQQPGLARL